MLSIVNVLHTVARFLARSDPDAMTESIAIIVPSTQRNGAPVAMPIQERENVARWMSQAFGGATATDSIGYWIDGNGATVKETVTIIESKTTRAVLRARKNMVHSYCAVLRETWNQDAVAFTVNGQLFFATDS